MIYCWNFSELRSVLWIHCDYSLPGCNTVAVWYGTLDSAFSCRMVVTDHQTTTCCNRENYNIKLHRRENLKSHIKYIQFT